jgi:hypothetical protein
MANQCQLLVRGIDYVNRLMVVLDQPMPRRSKISTTDASRSPSTSAQTKRDTDAQIPCTRWEMLTLTAAAF